MPRNSSGTYTLPGPGTLNPVISGTTITSTWANTTLNDIATAMTDSLDRSGQGAMLAPLRLVDGTIAAPALSFETEHPTGLYRAGTHDIRMGVNVVDIQTWTDTEVSFPTLPVIISPINSVGLTVTGGSASNGVVSTGGTGNTSGLVGNGTGTGYGVVGQGGATNGSGLIGTGGGSSGTGAIGNGAGSGSGLSGFGGSSGGLGVGGQGGAGGGHGVEGIGGAGGNGVVGVGGTGNTTGVTGAGAGSGKGGSFTGGGSAGTGVAAVGGSGGFALDVGSGHAHYSGGNPSASTSFSNTLTPLNFCKAWWKVQLKTTGPVLVAGFNTNLSAPVTANTTDVTFNFAASGPMAGNDYCVVAMMGGPLSWTPILSTDGTTTTSFNLTIGTNPLGAAANNMFMYVLVYGAQ